MPHAFVGLPDNDDLVFLYEHDGDKARQVLWGDFLTLDPQQSADPAFVNVLWGASGPNPTRLKVKAEHVAQERPLEIIFVDVGQGDGCVLITPERDGSERIMVIDAGKAHHMAEFLEQRFKIIKNTANLKFHAAVVTHPDEDHYGGFAEIFRDTKATFAHLYHSGLVERAVNGQFEKVGGKTKQAGDDVFYLRDLPQTDAAMRQAFQPAPGSFVYPRMIQHALDRNAVDSFAMVSTRHGDKEGGKAWLPGFGPSANKPYTIQVLGPWAEADANGDPKLRVFESNYGKTKNGHSVVLRLEYEDFSVVFGGDLNTPAEKFLLQQHTKITKWPGTIVERDVLVAEARKTFRADVLKVCHHGATDVTDEFLMATNPAAFVVSSGDQEGYVHPRPDLLGRLGRNGRGFSPVLLLTELQRSTREREEESLAITLKDLIDKQVAAPTPDRLVKISDLIRELSKTNVEVDGAIYLKTDGKRLITAFRNEENSDKKKWFYFRYKLENGMLIPKGIGG
jgi:beta-lactamase superfamily II metal-dependent hydrolase